jgi:hypothetical protein
MVRKLKRSIKKPERLKPISLYPLKPEEALRLFMQVKLRKRPRGK